MLHNNTIQWGQCKEIAQQRWPSKHPLLNCLLTQYQCWFVPLSLSGLTTLSHTCWSSYHKTHTNNLTLVVDEVHSQHFLLAKNTEANSVPLPDCVITALPPPWKQRAWLSIRQPDSSCVCSLLYQASKTRPLSLWWTPSLIHWIYTEL